MTFNHPAPGAVPDASSKFKSPPIHRTALYRAKAAYAGMLARCKDAKGKNPTYANVELRMTLAAWLEWSIPRYEEFFRHHPNLSPNAARFADAGHYEIGNIHIVSQQENLAERTHRCRAAGGTKLCSRCFEVKSVGEFNLRLATTDGYDYWCRGCKKEHYHVSRQK